MAEGTQKGDYDRPAPWGWVVFAVAMIAAPLSTFFGIKGYAQDLVQQYDLNPNMVGAAGAVAVAHVLIGGFVYAAWKRGLEEEAREDGKKKQ